jgi:hypothetical protein
MLGAAPATADVPAPSSQLSVMRAAYVGGDWLTLTRTARGLERSREAEELTLAARALVAACLAGQSTTCEDDMVLAERLARSAVAFGGPTAVEARLQLASALGLRSRHIGGMTAAQRGIPQEALAVAEEAARLSPGLPWAQAFVGVWHIEALRTGGAMAGFIGANEGQGLAAIDRALASPDADGVVGAQIALALAASDPRRHRARIDRALALANRAPPTDAFGEAMAERAAGLSGMLAAGDTPRDVKRYAVTASAAG